MRRCRRSSPRFPPGRAATALYNWRRTGRSNQHVRQRVPSQAARRLRRPERSPASSPGLIVEALNLEIPPGEIGPDQPLYGEGLGLDSIDILEIALVVSKQYGVQLRADSEDNERIFGSLRQLAEYVNAHRTK